MPEDFSSGGTPVQAGVLDFSSGGTPLDFASGGTRVKKTRDQVMAEVGAAQGRMDRVNPPETQGVVGRIAGSNLANNVVSGLSLQPLMHGIGEVASIPLNHIASEIYGARPQPFVIDRDSGQLSQAPGFDPYFGAGKPMVNVPMASPEQMPNVSALPRVLAQLAQGLTTPENLATLPLAAEKSVGGQLAATVFAPQMITSGLQSAPGIVTGETPQAREEAAYNTVINLLLGGKIGKGLVDGVMNQPITPEVLPPYQRPVAPVNRQLQAPPLPFTEAEFATPPRLPAPGERPTMPMGVPMDRPAGAARFGVDPSGRAVDVSQLTPKEQVELYRGPKESVPRETYVRPAQQAPVIIGEQPKPQQEVVFQNETAPVKPVFVPSRPPVEPSGGEISFRSPAGAEAVPSAGQSAPKGMQIKAAMERGQERRGETGSVFPRGDEGRVLEQAPKEDLAAKVRPMTGAQFREWSKSAEGGITAEAHRYGMGAKTQAQVDALKEGEVAAKGEMRAAMESGDMDGAMSIAVKGQFFREAHEAATGVGSAGEKLRKDDAGYKAPFPQSGGIGGGINKAIEKNREGGSVPNPFPFIVEKFKNKEKEKRGPFATDAPRVLLNPKESGFQNPTKEVDANQLVNRLKNTVHATEMEGYEKSGVLDEIRKLGKVSPEKAAEILQDGGVEVQTHSYGMEGKVSEAKREYDRMTHELESQQSTPGLKEWVQAVNMASTKGDIASIETQIKNERFSSYTPKERNQLANYIDKKRKLLDEPHDTSPRATSAYEFVSAFDTKEPMPEWTKSKEGSNVQRVDVVVPGKQIFKGDIPQGGPHDYDNTLGWAMIQYKTGPKGEKIAVVVESQSRWGQETSKLKKLVKEAEETKDNIRPGGPLAQNDAQRITKLQQQDHPLLKDYNRLILKAAIDQARKEGATHIMLSDAETAMMTEGHDAHRPRNAEMTTEESAKWRPEQEGGMRLNYDTILPKMMEELSGEKGERVSLGGHKNARDNTQLGHLRIEGPDLALDPNGPYTAINTITGVKKVFKNSEEAYRWADSQGAPRNNLIFRNPDGTPKTDVSGTMYKIPQTDKKFSLFEKDRPESVAGRLYMNPVGPAAKQAVKDLKKLGNGIKETTAKLKDYYKGAEDKVMPDLVFQNNNPLPDFQPKEIANKIFSQPFGSEKIPVLGRVMGGKARIRTPQDDAVAAWYAERHGVGPAVASSVGEQIRGQIKGVFKVDEKGNLNVRGMSAGQSLKMSDVFEGLRRDPLSYDLTVAQRKVFKQIVEPITKRMAELANKYDIIDEVVDENGDLRPYFPRIVTKHPKLEDKKNSSAFKTRAFNTEKEGWDRGYEYELDPEKRLVTGVERLYRAIANKRLAKDPILGAKSEVQVKAEIKQAYADKLATGEITQSKIDRIAEGIRTRGQVMQPILIRSIFDPETAKMLNKEFAAEQSTVRNAITSANSLMKATQLGFDLGVGQIQMLPLLYNNPKVWATAIYDSAKGMVNPEFFSTYVRANKEMVNELAQLGSSVGRLQEHMSGLGGETLLGKTPILGDVAQAFGRQFQTAMDVAKVELWKSLREGVPKKEWPKLVRSIETVLLSGRSESAMVPHGRALLERVALLAPSYYRGAIEHIAALGERGASGKVVRQSMGRFILGSAITFYAVAKALQMSEEEIKEGFNPGNTSFMTWKVKQEDGSVINIGFGGIFRSFIKLGADVIKVSREHPENWKSLASDKNPLTKWYRGHSGPTPSMVWDGFSGEDFMGRDVSLGTLAKGRLPLLAQEGLRNPEEPKATALDYGASTFGLSTRPESFGARRGREQEDVAKKQFGKEFKNLSPIQRLKVDGIVDAKTKNVPKGITKERSRELAMKLSDDRVQKLQDGLSEGAQAWLKEKEVEVGGYQSTMSVGGKQIRLTKEEGEKLQGKMVSAYENTIKKLMAHPNISKKEGAELQRYVNVHLENARKKVWGEMVRELSKNSREQR